MTFFFIFQGKGDVQTYWLTAVDDNLKTRISTHEEKIQGQGEDSTDGTFTIPLRFSPSLQYKLFNLYRRGSFPEVSGLPSHSKVPLLRRISSERHRRDYHDDQNFEKVPLLIPEDLSLTSNNAAVDSENIV